MWNTASIWWNLNFLQWPQSIFCQVRNMLCDQKLLEVPEALFTTLVPFFNFHSDKIWYITFHHVFERFLNLQHIWCVTLYHVLERDPVLVRPRGCHDLAKQLSHYLYFFSFLFFFLFLFGFTTQGGSIEKCHMTNITHHGHMTGCHSVTLHDECGKVVHRPCSSCISSIRT